MLSSKNKVIEKFIGFKLQNTSYSYQFEFTSDCDEKIMQTFYLKINKFLPQTEFDKYYEVVTLIGSGSFATVYLIHKKKTKRYYAMKAFKKSSALESNEIKRDSMINEIEIMNEINHPNCLSLRAIYETEKEINLVMELLKGGDLIELIQKAKKLQEHKAREIFKGILKGLCYLHEHQIMHRDLKPENILFREGTLSEADVCIIDFGLATFYNPKKVIFVRCGTPGYMAPEIINMQEKQSLSYDSTCDVFSLGAIYFLMLFGLNLFPGTEIKAVIELNKTCNIDIPESLANSISPEGYDLLKKMLEKNPAKRIKSNEI
eukprot:TRINITY_DN4907_c0_g1_i2.p2 TRINITY_DN4907_c0_g1~~TRINITY_DN4907_c0_g1_i2.p2  ORF type:complete len:318 (+),score=66.08 TRINITY_DN4907_c0_g1_i2:254-1207(+)